jgi:hypothetical protein
VRVAGLQAVAALGASAAGEVWLCEQPALGRQVAVRRVSAALVDDPQFRARFVAEARLLARLSDIHTVAVYDLVEEADGGLALLMEYVPGASLRVLLDGGSALLMAQALGVVADTLAGLSAAHRIGVVHRDLRPNRVLVDPAGIAKLGGFAVGPTGNTSYLAPECRGGGPPDMRSDLYAAGMMLAETLGRCRSGRHRPAAPPPPIATVLTRALSVDPAGRYPSAPDFAAELDRAADSCLGAGWQRQASLAGLVALAAASGAAGMAGMAGLAGANPAGGWQAAAAQHAGANLAAGTAPRIGRAPRLPRPAGNAARQGRRAGRIGQALHHIPGAAALAGSPVTAAVTAGAVVAVAVGGAVAASTLAGGHHRIALALATWSRAPSTPSPVNAPPFFGALSCATKRFCMYLANARAFVWNGTAWSTVPAPGPTGPANGISGLSCTGSGFCIAVFSRSSGTTPSPTTRWTSYAQQWDGSGWRSPVQLDSYAGGAGYGVVHDVSCTSPSFCMAIGGNFGSAVWNGSGWHVVPTAQVEGQDGGEMLSCGNPAFCMGAPAAPHTVIWDGRRWGPGTQPLPGGNSGPLALGFTSLSCRSASFCMASGAGELYRWNGSSWLLSTRVPGTAGPRSGYPAEPSCPSASFCVAVTGSGAVIDWNGRTWSAPQQVIRGQDFEGPPDLVSCASRRACLLVYGSETYRYSPRRA